MLKAVLVDDDARDLEVLHLLLQQYCADEIHISGTASGADEAILLILEKKPQLVFLDVELGGVTAFDMLAGLPGIDFKLIFVTAYEKYAVRAIKFNALDYILKPVEIAELLKAVKKVKGTNYTSIEEDLKNLIHTLAYPHNKDNRIAIPVINGFKMVTVGDIIYCEAQKEYTNIHTTDQHTICSSVNIGEYEDLLKDYSFCRVHHSYLVNKDYVKQYIKGEGGELVINKGVSVPVSRRKKPDVLEWLTGYIKTDG